MKNIIIYLILVYPSFITSTVINNKPSKMLLRVFEHIKKNKPTINERQGLVIAMAIMNNAKKHNLDWKLLSAISMQESSYDIDACRNKKIKNGQVLCTDYGLAQIHFKNVNNMNLNKDYLITSPEYNLNTAGHILKTFYSRFGTKRDWWVHYHGGNSLTKRERLYKNLVMRYY